MRLKKYLTEISIKRKTVIEPPRYYEEHKYDQTITLEGDTVFEFNATYWDDEEEWEISFWDEYGSTDIERKRKGASLELFAALEKVFKEFLKKTNPNKFYFSAKEKEKSRVKLYDLLANKIKKLLKSYKYTTKMGRGGYKEYHFENTKGA